LSALGLTTTLLAIAALAAIGEPSAAIAAPGDRVRIERVQPKEEGAAPLYRVRVAGRFPPRAERYELLADGRLIAYARPAANSRAVRAITTDPAVLDARISVAYAGGEPPAIEPVAPRRVPGALTRRGPVDLGNGVTRAVYHLGNRAFQPSDLGDKVELTADVHYPTGLPAGPYPLVLFMHGNHVTCFKERRVRFQWPCRDGFKPLPNYAGYDYIAARLAARGYVVVSISANGVNVLGERTPDTGMRQRGELLDRHLELWRRWSRSGGRPFGSTFVGEVDLSRIGTMGHSRGGEGVVWHRIVDEERSRPFGIDAVMALAPVDFTRVLINETPFAVVLPYCDGDVYDLQGVHFFDDSRYAVPGDPAPKHTVTVFGANHNFFNTVWTPSAGYPGAFNDRAHPCRRALGAPAQRRIGASYVISFFRRYVGGETRFDPVWTGASDPAGILPRQSLVSYLAPGRPATRLDLTRFTRRRDLRRTRPGGRVVARGLSVRRWCRNTIRMPCVRGRMRGQDVHSPTCCSPSARGLSRGVFGWRGHGGVIRLMIPSGEGDVSGFEALQFRAVPNPSYRANGGLRYQDLAVALIDGSGNSAEVLASEVGNEALAYPLVGRRLLGHVILNQVRFPLSRFVGVDLTDVRAVELRFSRTQRGVLDIADLAFTAPPG
jgi:hypothetical protein